MKDLGKVLFRQMFQLTGSNRAKKATVTAKAKMDAIGTYKPCKREKNKKVL